MPKTTVIKKRRSRRKAQSPAWTLELGANIREDGKTVFRVWAPRCKEIVLKIIRSSGTELFPMNREDDGFFMHESADAGPGVNYYYQLNGEHDRPDPVSRFQPHGVHGPSEIIDPGKYRWADRNWKGIDLKDFIFYEIHTGTFTREGTFESVIKKLPYLKKLGVTCLELMPVAQFPGVRNWGYDGVGMFAVQNSYGGPERLKKLVDACHRQKIAVCLDVVYNHLGPEGNYLHDYGPYFTDHYHTPWGDALNYDDAGSTQVRRFIIENALYWISEYHVDALRLDAVHGIYDFGAYHILQELKDRTQQLAEKLGRKVSIIAESDLNDARLLKQPSGGGFGLDSQWSDDFHHALHVCLTGEQRGYYSDYKNLADLAKAVQNHFVYDWAFSTYRNRWHGSKPRALPGEKFVQYIQNHDQVGNRAWGDRIGIQISFEAQKLAATLTVLGVHLPFLWMGQEYGERNPFQYFVDHGDEELVEAVRQGRKKEFLRFGWSDVPDPADPATFENSKLDWRLAGEGRHKKLTQLYIDLIKLRKKLGFLKNITHKGLRVAYDEPGQWLAIRYVSQDGRKYVILGSFSEKERLVKLPFRTRLFTEQLNTENEIYGGFLAKNKSRRHSAKMLLSSVGAVVGRVS